jgi:hypothetical protein
VAFLHLPRGSVVTMDQQPVVLLQPNTNTITSNGDLWMAIQNVPFSRFHLTTVRASADSMTTVGFLLFSTTSTSPDASFVRAFDCSTEEVSSFIDTLTSDNFLMQLPHMDVNRSVLYSHLVPPAAVKRWNQLSSYITNDFLAFKNIQSGDKIVPGSAYTIDDEANSTAVVVDGYSLHYPHIPVIQKPSNNNNNNNNKRSTLRHTTHDGTKQFLAARTPAERTALFLHPSTAFSMLLKVSYANKWQLFLGDMQLAFVVFLQMHCYASFCHWRDAVALASLCGDDDNEYSQRQQQQQQQQQQHEEWRDAFLQTLTAQLHHQEDLHEFLQSDTDDDYFMCAVLQLCRTMQVSSTTMEEFERILEQKKLLEPTMSRDNKIQIDYERSCMNYYYDDDDDDDKPVLVSAEDIEASLHRSSGDMPTSSTAMYMPNADDQVRYPLLLAARVPTEDVLMTCARALYDANDVSLVREAAAYLQTIEAKRQVE